jgi:glycosyltransferase involved in cell wall biosynthesis
MISLLHPSRGRPQKAYDTLSKWLGDYMRGHDFEHILSLDASDPTLTQYQELFRWGYQVIVNNNNSVVEATNAAAKVANGDIFIYLSDDFSCPDGWIKLVEDEFAKYQGPTLIKVDDCLQKFEVPVLTIPIMNRALHKKLGYFWYPEYKSMFVDEDLYWTARKLGALKMAPHLKFPHEHHSLGKAQNDDTYRRSEANWNQGKAVLARRKAQVFPL